MTPVRPIEPSDGWRAGDLAYCVNATAAMGILEKGRSYTVESVTKAPHQAWSGLTFKEILAPSPYLGFGSSRFVRLRRGHSFLRQITEATAA